MPYLEFTGATHSILGTVTRVFWLLQGQQLPSASTYFLSPLSALVISQVSCSYFLMLLLLHPITTAFLLCLDPTTMSGWLALALPGHTRQRCSCILCHPLHYSVPCMICQLVSMILLFLLLFSLGFLLSEVSPSTWSFVAIFVMYWWIVVVVTSWIVILHSLFVGLDLVGNLRYVVKAFLFLMSVVSISSLG